MLYNKKASPEMKALIEDLDSAYRSVFWNREFFGERKEERVMGEDGGIQELRKRFKAIEAGVAAYKKALSACEKQLELEAKEVYGISDLALRIKHRLVRMGCRTRDDVHLTTIWRYKNPGWGRKSERDLSEWKDNHVEEWRESRKAREE